MVKYTSKRKYTPRKNMKSIARSEAKKVFNRNTETKCKWLDIDEASFTTLTQFYPYDPLQIVQGDGSYQRDGTEIRLQGMHLKGILHNNGTETNYVRMIVYRTDLDSNLGTSVGFFNTPHDDVDTPATVTGLNQMYYPLDKTVAQKVYIDKVYKLSATTSTDGTHTRFFNHFIKLHNLKIKYQHNSTGAEACFPRLHVVFLTADADDDTVSQIIEGSCLVRTWYKD